MWDQVAQALLAHGVLGLIVLVEGAVIYRLYRRVEDLQDKRVEDFKLVASEYREALDENTKSIETLARQQLEERSRRGP